VRRRARAADSRSPGQTVDPALRTSRGEHFALHDQVVVVGEREARLRESRAKRGIGRRLEHGARAVRTLTDGVAVNPATQCEREPAEQHRLA